MRSDLSLPRIAQKLPGEIFGVTFSVLGLHVIKSLFLCMHLHVLDTFKAMARTFHAAWGFDWWDDGVHIANAPWPRNRFGDL